MRARPGTFEAIVLSALAAWTVSAARAANPWDPGVERPSREALQSRLYIMPVAPADRAELTFTVTEQMGIARKAAPVRGGLPFFRGELGDPAKVRLLDAAGAEVPVQGLVTSWWPEKTVRWLVIDFLTDIGAGETRSFTLEYGSKVSGAKRSSLKVSQDNASVRIDTGRMKVSFSPGARFSGPVEMTGGGTSGDILGVAEVLKGSETARATAMPLRVDWATLTESGPVQATVYLTGGHGDEKVAGGTYKYPFHGHVRVYGDTCRMEVVHSFGYNGDENSDFVRRYGLVLPVKAEAGSPLIYGGDMGRPAEAPLKDTLTLLQGRNDWWRLTGDAEAKGRRFGGWAALKTAAGHVTVAYRNAWQQWPVTFEAKAGGRLACYIYGAPEGEFLDLRYQGAHFGKSKSMYCGPKLSNYYGGGNGKAAGILKIGELTMDFAADPADAGAGVHVPLVAFAGPRRIAQTKALGHIGTYEGAAAAGVDTAAMKRWAGALLDFPVIQHEANGYYGWVDWPDQGDCNPPKDGKFAMIMAGGAGWTNAERALLPYYFHYAAGGPERYLHLGHAMALHTIGIDMEHPGGESRIGCGHRHDQVHWREGGTEPRQNGHRGWYADYWMTGHPEIGRILKQVFIPLGYKSLDYLPKPGPGPDKVQVAMKGSPYNYPLLLEYLTDLNPVWIKHHKAIDEVVYRVASAGGGIPYDRGGGGTLIWQDGKIEKITVVPGQKIAGYWLTYGGDDMLIDHASLFGYEKSIKAVAAWGDSYFGEGQKPASTSSYHSPEYGYTGYYLLTRNERALEALKGRLRMYGFNRVTGEPLKWDSYAVKGAADDWHKLVGQGYGKNGFKIWAAHVFEGVYALAAFEASRAGPPVAPAPRPAPPKPWPAQP